MKNLFNLLLNIKKKKFFFTPRLIGQYWVLDRTKILNKTNVADFSIYYLPQCHQWLLDSDPWHYNDETRIDYTKLDQTRLD